MMDNQLLYNDLLAQQRINQLQQQQEQRRIQYMAQGLGDRDAATHLNRLNLANSTSMLAPIILGAGIGGLIGHAEDDSKSNGSKTGVGLLLGGGAGAVIGALMRGAGSVYGNLSQMPKNDLRNRVRELTVDDYLVPGKASYLLAQLNKSHMQNEKGDMKPKQLVF